MRVSDLFHETGWALGANRARTLLTALGIIIGIASVVALTSIIGGLKEAEAHAMGLDQARRVNMCVTASRPITLEDLERLEKMLPDFECLDARNEAGVTATAGKKSIPYMNLYGCEPQSFHVWGQEFSKGAGWDDTQEKGKAQVIVLERATVRALFGDPDKDVVGQTVKLNGMDFEVVGVLDTVVTKDQGNGYGYIPFSTCAERITGNWNVEGAFSGLAKESVDMDAIVKPTQDVLVDYFGIVSDGSKPLDELVWVMTMKSLVERVHAHVASYQMITAVVAGISLVVGGVGVMNMMLTTVTERMREIGLRKALGARGRDISRQFLLESILLTVVCGMIGVIVGVLLAYALADVIAGSISTRGLETGTVTPLVEVGTIVLAMGVSVLIGIIFGYYPAKRAAALDPVESLQFQ